MRERAHSIVACMHEMALPLQREATFSKLGHLRAYGHMRRPWEKTRSMAVFVDKVELSFCFKQTMMSSDLEAGTFEHAGCVLLVKI